VLAARTGWIVELSHFQGVGQHAVRTAEVAASHFDSKVLVEVKQLRIQIEKWFAAQVAHPLFD
jgi:hypothetical protein